MIQKLLFVLFIGLSVHSFAQTAAPNPHNSFLVHITAFIEPKPGNYFDKLQGVYMKRDNKGLYHYYLGGYNTLEEAETVKKKTIESGYPYTYVIDVEQVRRDCKASCGTTEPTLDIATPESIRSVQNVRHLFFDYNKSGLSADSKAQLSHLVDILQQNTGYLVEFKGHADGHGTPEYNQELSEKRSDMAKQYVVNMGVSSNRLRTSSYGMEAPIAKNEINGKDCPEGRKFNRRVEIFVTDVNGNVLNALVEPIDIPSELLTDHLSASERFLVRSTSVSNKNR